MTVQDAINALSQLPPSAVICLQHSSEFFPIQDLKLVRAYQGASPQWLYSAVEFPQDYHKTEVVKVIRKK
jgi:hypothetical protein